MPPCNRILPSRRGHLLTADAPFIANADTSRAIDAGEAAKLIDALRAKNGVGPDVSAIIMHAAPWWPIMRRMWRANRPPQ